MKRTRQVKTKKRRNGYLQDIARRPLLQLLAGSSGVTCLRTREPGESERLIGSHSARSLTPASATPAAVYGDSSSGERRERDLIFRPEPAGRRPFFLFFFFQPFCRVSLLFFFSSLYFPRIAGLSCVPLLFALFASPPFVRNRFPPPSNHRSNEGSRGLLILPYG